MIGIPNHYTGQSTAHIGHEKAHEKSIFQEFRLSTWKRTKAKNVLKWLLLLVLSRIVVVVVVVVVEVVVVVVVVAGVVVVVVVVVVEIVVVPVGLCLFHG